MAWLCSAASNSQLVEKLHAAGIITKEKVKQAMLHVDRKFFTPSDSFFHAYSDAPQPIGYGATISAPHMHAYALNYLEPFLKPGSRVLDVGSGSGYLCACFSEMVGEEGLVVGIEHILELVESSIQNLKQWNPHGLETGRIKCIAGDGRKGYPECAPYDAIHVGAAAKESVLDTLFSQLKSPGRLIIPVEGKYTDQVFKQIDKDENGNIVSKSLMEVRYVPLTDTEKQLGIGY